MELADDSMSNKQYMGYCSAELDSHQTTPDKRREKQISGTAGGRWRWQHKTVLVGEVVCAL